MRFASSIWPRLLSTCFARAADETGCVTREIPRLAVRLLSLSALALSFAGDASPAQQAEWAVIPEPPAQELAEHRRLTAALDALKPQRPGIVDAYVVVDALDGDAVFNREAREAGRV